MNIRYITLTANLKQTDATMSQHLRPDDLEYVQTDDLSYTFLNKKLNVHYRSQQGAQTESEQVFIKGTQIEKYDQWNIVELGFGCAMNFQCLLQSNTGQPIHYIAIDHQPVPAEILPQENVAMRLANKALAEVRKSSAPVTIKHRNITLELHPCPFDSATIPENFAHAFFHDPFSPSTNPECWTSDCFRLARRTLHHDGVLATYGAAGHARRAMAAAGFYIATAKGPGRKREITFASRNVSALQHATLIRKYPPVVR